ncbi:hypothetical protein [Streptomyces sp. WAC01280]|nr:hypothetical protein [Streptomyces sp. WAC01280]
MTTFGLAAAYVALVALTTAVPLGHIANYHRRRTSTRLAQEQRS